MVFLARPDAPNTPSAEVDITARMLQQPASLSVIVRIRMDSLGGVLSSLTRPNRLKHTEKDTPISPKYTYLDVSFVGRSKPRDENNPIIGLLILKTEPFLVPFARQ